MSISYWLKAHNFKRHFENPFQRYFGDGTNVLVGNPDETHIQTSVLNDIDELFETASISAIEDSIKNDENYQYSFLFQKFTADELKFVQKKESNYLKRFARYSGQSNHVSIDEKEMKDSESESRYAFLYSVRVTTILQASSHCNDRLSKGRLMKNKRLKNRQIIWRSNNNRRSKNR